MNLRDNARAHLLTRAKIASKLIKYPHIEDYAVRRTLKTLCFALSDLKTVS